jgi:hypothetical protein
MHNCYACDRIFSDEGGEIRARFPGRFAGPPGHANGGIIVGSLACPALRAAAADGGVNASVARIAARLRVSVSLETPLAVDTSRTASGFEVTVRRDDVPLASGVVEPVTQAAAPGAVIAEPPADIAADLASLGGIEPPDRAPFFEETGEHPIPGCFSCGPKHPDGLHLYPRVAGDGIVCAPWAPAAEFDDGGGAVSTMVLTSALDCSSGICLPVDMQRELLDLDQFFLLGSLDVRYLRVPAVGGKYRVAAKMLRRDGRKFFGLSGLFDQSGAAYACAEATWIVAGVTRSQAFGAPSAR